VKVFVPMLAAHAGIRDQDLLEKDVRLHLLLDELARDASVGPDLIFKGGTCLIKCYLDYPRFSTDLDFTWRPRDAWDSLGTKALRRALRPVQRGFLERLSGHAAAQGLRFDSERDVQFGQSNRMMTVLLRYESVARLPGLVKMQVNFTEPLLYSTKRVEAHGLLKGDLPGALRLLDSDLPKRYARAVQAEAYDPREILAEKCRAILTRQATKAKDLLDLYLIEKDLGFRVEDHLDAVRRKVQFSAERTERYRRHVAAPGERFKALLEEDVRPLLLREIDLGGFEAYRRRILGVLAAQGRALRETRGL